MDVSKIKFIATYFTQLHDIPENDKWWGKGFTDWVNVKKSKRLFEGHNQPRVPLHENYYDQSDIKTLHDQIDLAKKYGVFGFCHYHYWFDGKQLLEKPTNIMLENTDIDFPFCLSWANETWSRQWDGLDHDILIKQTHPPIKERWKKHFDYLIRAWKDKRAIKVDGKPVFIIYRPQRIENINEMIVYWREQAVNAGLKGLYIMYQSQYEIPLQYLREFDAQFLFQPFNSMNESKCNFLSCFLIRVSRYISKCIKKSSYLDKLILSLQVIYKDIFKSKSKLGPTYDIRSYDEVWGDIINQDPQYCIANYEGAFVDWDNTARYGDRATIFDGATPERFEYWLGKLAEKVIQDKNDEKFIFINAWNEWAEGAYLEPDERYQYQYLDAISRVLRKE